MMFNDFWSRIERRYALTGSVFGAFLPVVCVTVDFLFREASNRSVFQFTTPTATALALMPVFFGFGFYQIGRSKAQLMFELAQRRQTEALLMREALHDRLTGLANRFSLERDIQRLVADGDRDEGRGALLLLDLDRFKFVNDSLGHDVGDELLIAIGKRLRDALESAGRIYRLGGDEFVVTIPGSPSYGKVEDVCRTLCGLFDAPFELARNRITTGCSIGVTFFEPSDRSMSFVLKRADLALYEAKDAPGSAFRFFDADLAREAQEQAEIEHDLARAFSAGEFYLEYQPIVGVETRSVRSFEALLRWRHPEKGIILPDRFIPSAERTGVIRLLGNWVVEKACQEAAKWPGPIGVAVNVVGDQFKDREFVGHVKRCLKSAELAPGRLTIEVTESTFSVDEDVIRESLTELRAHGVRVALDDFGAGFSSIHNLRCFPLDQLKIDRSFAQSMLNNKRDADLLEIILKLGDTFQVATTVEGIECEKQFEFIRARGASEAQGFLISRPVAASMVPAILAPQGKVRSA
ncbi:EAL domain-containing protein [Sinorhizobium sp. BG8]|uniref:putative bifunctional diguanylate cyclase/phosphodiesterase n=1 Tax=Sinorhizobium sp. BG8 TaxID=2613773 RepID=UPI00193E15EC|nr:EAL domain-containing protein [Sinorhizobium sp. BG8]QRM56004.1 EAL domain-containing protein [Sinorhizobium sp. BG8]